jgi:hypothetical protein
MTQDMWQYTAEFSSMDGVEIHINEQFINFLRILEKESLEPGLRTMMITLPCAKTPNAFRQEMLDGWFRVMVQWPLHDVDVKEDFLKYMATGEVSIVQQTFVN